MNKEDFKMIEFVLGAVVGVAGGAYAKDKLFGDSQEKQDLKREMNSLYAENEKFHKKNKEMERQIEDLLAEKQKLRRQYKAKDDDQDDLEDSLADAQKEIKKLRLQNDELSHKMREYKAACEHYELEIARLKDNIG